MRKNGGALIGISISCFVNCRCETSANERPAYVLINSMGLQDFKIELTLRIQILLIDSGFDNLYHNSKRGGDLKGLMIMFIYNKVQMNT